MKSKKQPGLGETINRHPRKAQVSVKRTPTTGESPILGSVSYKDGMFTVRGQLAARFQRIVAITGKTPQATMTNAIVQHCAPAMKKDTIRVTLEFRPGTLPHTQLLELMARSGELPDTCVAVIVDNDLVQQAHDSTLLPCEADLIADYAGEKAFGGASHIPKIADRVVPVGIELVAGKKTGVRK